MEAVLGGVALAPTEDSRHRAFPFVAQSFYPNATLLTPWGSSTAPFSAQRGQGFSAPGPESLEPEQDWM